MKHRRETETELETATKIWPSTAWLQSEQLKVLIKTYRFSIRRGDLQVLNGRWYVTSTGLLALSHRRHCFSVHTHAIPEFCDPAARRWAFRAVVYKSRTCKGFIGYGDADPSNVSPLVRGAEMRVAETRAVNRALRKAYGIGICSVEEIGSSLATVDSARLHKKAPLPAKKNGVDGQPRLRDRLCQLIRQHQLDPVLVKAYAIDFCGTKTLKEATREQVEKFVTHLADWTARDKNALVCQLNSYLRQEEGAA